jgi:hypothetical protein
VRPEYPPQMGQFCRGGGRASGTVNGRPPPLGLEFRLFALSDVNELPAVMAAMKRDGFDGLTHLSDGAVYEAREYVCRGRRAHVLWAEYRRSEPTCGSKP